MFLKIKNHGLAILLSFLASSVGNIHSHTSDHDHSSPLTNQHKPGKNKFYSCKCPWDNHKLARHHLGLNSRLPAK